MLNRAEKNLILVAVLAILSFAYQNCAQSDHSQQAHVTAEEVPALGEKVTGRRMATLAQTLKEADPVAPYSIHEIELSGVKLREYVTPEGVVFAVTWRGFGNPDLSQLLGSYYSDYRAAKSHKKRSKGRQFEKVETPQLIVRRAGHMRDLHGQAYDVRLFPKGFTAEDLQ
jgi:hypothetical protein